MADKMQQYLVKMSSCLKDKSKNSYYRALLASEIFLMTKSYEHYMDAIMNGEKDINDKNKEEYTKCYAQFKAMGMNQFSEMRINLINRL